MAIAFGRIGRFKAWIKTGIGNFFRGIKNSIVRAIRGSRGGNGSGSGGADIIALEVTDEKDFQVIDFKLCKLDSRPRIACVEKSPETPLAQNLCSLKHIFFWNSNTYTYVKL